MKCRKKHCCSPEWAEILRTRWMLAKGLFFRVGRGDSINIWEDPWVPNCSNFRPLPNPGLGREWIGMVDLLKNANGNWNMELLETLFDHTSVANIRKVLCHRTMEKDKLLWIGNKSGSFSVKSIYKMENWNHSNGSKWWSSLWKSELHTRLKMFLWKVGNMGLSTKERLVKRGLQIPDSTCPHGCGCPEDECHLFLKCNIAKAIWFASPCSLRWDNFHFDNVIDFLSLLLNPIGILPVLKEDAEEFLLFSAIAMEQIWWFRNKVVHGDLDVNVEECTRGLMNKFGEYKTAARAGGKACMAELREGRLHEWSCPHRGVVKINCDAAVRPLACFLGAVARDHEGRVIKVQTARIEECIPEVAELHAIFRALQLATQEGWNHICCEGDAGAVIQSLHNADHSSLHWSSDILFKDILNLRSCFASVVFVWVPRSCNQLAHITCQWASNLDVMGSLELEQLPPSFLFCMAQEQSLLASS